MIGFVSLVVLASSVFGAKVDSGKWDDSKVGAEDETLNVQCFESADETEGDMILTKNALQKNVLLDWKYRWKSGIVYYQFDPSFSKSDKASILEAMLYIGKQTCIVFKKRKNETDYVFIQLQSKVDGCSANVGMIGGKQLLKLARRCLKLGIIVHELLHTLGCHHQHNAHNRDKYVKIIWENVKPNKTKNFQTCSECRSYENGYDYYSVMHYSSRAFSTDGKVTIETLDPSMQNIIGQRDELSEKDIQKLQIRYKCPKQPLGRRSLASQVNGFVLLQILWLSFSV